MVGSWSPPAQGGAPVRRPWLGAKLQTVTPRDRREPWARPAGRRAGRRVVDDAGPAAEAGLRRGDVIVADRRPGGRRCRDDSATACATQARSAAMRQLGVLRDGQAAARPRCALQTRARDAARRDRRHARRPHRRSPGVDASPICRRRSPTAAAADIIGRGRGRGRRRCGSERGAVGFQQRRRRPGGQRRDAIAQRTRDLERR